MTLIRTPWTHGLVLESSKWIVAELVRVFHSVTTDVAADVVERLIERTLPIVWEVGSTKRVLNPSLSKKSQALLLLYSSRTSKTCAGGSSTRMRRSSVETYFGRRIASG